MLHGWAENLGSPRPGQGKLQLLSIGGGCKCVAMAARVKDWVNFGVVDLDEEGVQEQSTIHKEKE